MYPRDNSEMNLEELDTKYKAQRKSWDEDHRIRVHRAISWLKSSEKYSADPDIAFMGALNAMNALWGQLGVKDKDAIDGMANNLTGTRAMTEIVNIFRTQQGAKWLTMLIDNKHLYWQYWRFLQGEMDETEYKRKSAQYRQQALRAVREQKHSWLLKAVMTQAVVLRSQVFHGFTTYDSKANREIISLTAKMMRKMAIAIANAQIDEPNRDWGQTPWTFGSEKKAPKPKIKTLKFGHARALI